MTAPTHAEHVAALARAIRRASEQHGTPNWFPAAMLADRYGAPSRSIAWPIIQSERVALADACAAIGVTIEPDDAPHYYRVVRIGDAPPLPASPL